MFARELDGPLHCIHYLKFRSKPHAPFKYVMQSVATWRMLFRERPRAVHVQTPPFLCGLVVAAYCRMTGARFVVEYHSAAFEPIWRWAAPLQRLVARRATANIVTSDHWAEIVRSWGGETIVMYDAFLDLPDGAPYEVGPGLNFAFISTFAEDEPVAEVLEAAARLPTVHVHVTGDLAKAPRGLVASAPPNVTFTGFLDPNTTYLGLLRAVDAAIVLTTRDHTLQLAGCEAAALGKPLVTSDWPYLRRLFPYGAEFVEPTAGSIRQGIARAVRRLDELKHENEMLVRLRRREWNARVAQLHAMVGGHGNEPVTRPA
jgi:glycosyltransferase involved in cell wall biosynthesis